MTNIIILLFTILLLLLLLQIFIINVYNKNNILKLIHHYKLSKVFLWKIFNCAHAGSKRFLKRNHIEIAKNKSLRIEKICLLLAMKYRSEKCFCGAKTHYTTFRYSRFINCRS